ncbi:hypothetical protein [Modestobacter sp. NPDC049651]|uniref:hypothetical protein n=1 Tax=unclassified Modestobacter TaxID=2643866 RepID=UPI0033EBB063
MTPRTAAVLALALLVAGCARADAGNAGPADDDLPADGDALVLQVAVAGGFRGLPEQAGRLPVVSVHADGRAFSTGPVAAVFPGPAWPDVLVTRLDRAQLRDLLDRAVAAGAAERGDLGRPGLADATTTRFTVWTGSRAAVREVYGLTEGVGDPQLTGDQQAARQRLLDLLGDLPAGEEPYEPAAVAVLAVPPGGDPRPEAGPSGAGQPAVPWPGPALPGEPLAGGAGCTLVTGDDVRVVTAAARQADALTPWTAADGTPWSLAFRPLLPHETGCADLAR